LTVQSRIVEHQRNLILYMSCILNDVRIVRVILIPIRYDRISSSLRDRRWYQSIPKLKNVKGSLIFLRKSIMWRFQFWFGILEFFDVVDHDCQNSSDYRDSCKRKVSRNENLMYCLNSITNEMLETKHKWYKVSW